MANVYLEGGPCNGRSVPSSEIQGGLVAYVVCKGADYINSGKRRHNGELIFTYSASGVPQPPSSGGVRAPHALSAWADLQRTINKGLPAMLRQTGGLNRATRNALARRRRVGH